MTLVKKYCFLIVLLLHYGFIFGQTNDQKISLRDAFEQIETRFTCNFSFVDNEVINHFIVSDQNAQTLEETLVFLGKNTLFNYTVLEDRTIAVSKKASLISACFTVLDEESNLPLADVTVATPYQQFPTNSDGRVSFDVISLQDAITLSFTGYDENSLITQTVSKRPCRFIVLSKRIEYLNPVILKNYLAKGIDRNIDGSLTINYDDFDILPGLIESDVLQTIQALPGIQSVNETVSFINIRGGTNDQNLILWDGIKMYQSGHFFGLISAFNPNLTQEVTLIKNGASASIGDGVSGVISMDGDPNVNPEFEASIGTNLINSDAFIDAPLGTRASIQVSGRKSIDGLIETPTYNSYFDKAFQNTEVIAQGDAQTVSGANFTFFDTHVRFLYAATDKDYFRVNFMALGNQLEFLENALVDDVSFSLRSDLSQNNLSGGGYYRRIWNPAFTSDVQWYGSSYELKATNSDILNNQRLSQENRVLESGVKLSSNYTFSEVLSAQFGYQFNETGITNFEQINNPLFERTEKQVLRTNSIFAEMAFQPKNNQTVLNLGVRVNHVGKFNEVLWEPRVSFNHRFLKNFTFELLGEIKSQTTSQIIDFQNDFLGVENRRWILSNPNEIPILKGKQLSAGVTYSRNGWLVNVEPYVKEVTGVTSQSQGFQNQFENTRTNGSYRVKGVDLLINKRFKKINTWLSYSYADNTYTFEELIPQNFPNNIDITHTFTYGIDVSLNNFKVSGGLNWHSGRPTTTPVLGNEIIDNEVNFDSPNAANIKDYMRVDVSCVYNFNISDKIKGLAGISIWNLLNTNNTVNSFYRTLNVNDIEQVNERALDFTPNATLRILF